MNLLQRTKNRTLIPLISRINKNSIYLQYSYFSKPLFRKDKLFDKTELFDDAIHPKQRAQEKATRLSDNNKSKNKLINKDFIDPVSKRKKEYQSTHDYLMDHPIWSQEEVLSIKPSHRPPIGFSDRLAYICVSTLRIFFDLFSGYFFGKMTPKKVLTRVVILETIAGVPGMVGAMIRHLHSLRLMRRDYGWIHTLLEEAENERMHLLTAIKIKKPGYFVRSLVLIAQGFFVNLWFLAYLISPKFCHRFVGYLEEEAVITYTNIVNKIDQGDLKVFDTMEAPKLARTYWRLPTNSTMKDMFLAMRADEKHHCLVNHDLASQGPLEPNRW